MRRFHYYRELAKAQAAELLVIHADMGRVLGDVEWTWLSAVTPHICIRELQEISPLPLVNIIEEGGSGDSFARL